MTNQINKSSLDAKRLLADFATSLLFSEMRIGLGSGTTIHVFIDALGNRVTQGLTIETISSSHETTERARSRGINVVDVPKHSFPTLSLMVDGADWVFPSQVLIKGLGGALAREKIVAKQSRFLVILVEEKKIYSNLKHTSLIPIKIPVEVISFGYQTVLSAFNSWGFEGKLRIKDGSIFITDNHNYIIDVQIKNPPQQLKEWVDLDHRIKLLHGVVETGIFHEFSPIIVIAKENSSLIFDFDPKKHSLFGFTPYI